MELTISWTKEDIERKLREELEESGFRLIEASPSEEPPEEGKKKRKEPQTFQWSYRPAVSVTVKAEPDPDAVFATEEAAEEEDATPALLPVEDEDEDVDIPEGTGLLPLGAATAINKAVKAQKEGKTIGRRRMKGESDERP